MPHDNCSHMSGSLPFAIQNGIIVWCCMTCPETWVDDMTPDEGLRLGYILQSELDTMQAMR